MFGPRPREPPPQGFWGKRNFFGFARPPQGHPPPNHGGRENMEPFNGDPSVPIPGAKRKLTFCPPAPPPGAPVRAVEVCRFYRGFGRCPEKAKFLAPPPPFFCPPKQPRKRAINRVLTWGSIHPAGPPPLLFFRRGGSFRSRRRRSGGTEKNSCCCPPPPPKNPVFFCSMPPAFSNLLSEPKQNGPPAKALKGLGKRSPVPPPPFFLHLFFFCYFFSPCWGRVLKVPGEKRTGFAEKGGPSLKGGPRKGLIWAPAPEKIGSGKTLVAPRGKSGAPFFVKRRAPRKNGSWADWAARDRNEGEPKAFFLFGHRIAPRGETDLPKFPKKKNQPLHPLKKLT